MQGIFAYFTIALTVIVICSPFVWLGVKLFRAHKKVAWLKENDPQAYDKLGNPNHKSKILSGSIDNSPTLDVDHDQRGRMGIGYRAAFYE